MKRIILHWTAGAYFPSFFDKQFYHYLVDSNGAVHCGKYPPEANLDVSTGRYAAHTGGGNTASIGVALCAMAGFESAREVGLYPITAVQLESAFALCAELCREYDLPITAFTLMTHYEFGLANPKTSSAGKIDINFLPPYPDVEARNVGGFIRSKVKWYKQKTDAGLLAPIVKLPYKQ